MANILLPAAGRHPVTRQEEFAFHCVRELPKTDRCSGYDCENIPRNIFDYKCPDCPTECPQVQHHRLQQQQQWQQQQQQQQQQWQRQQQHQQRPPTTPHYQAQHHDLQHHPQGLSNQWPHPRGGLCQSQGNNNTHQQHESASVHATNIAPAISAQTSVVPINHGPFTHTGDQKRPTIPMSNCQPLSCFGDPCACRAPEGALWGKSPFDVSTCAWTQGRRTASMRVPDPQVVRPHDKSLPDDTRPTGHPYFTHGAPTCPPHEAPIAKGSGFNFDQWLATTRDREPPRHLKNKCISSLCTLCGPVTVECCPGYQIPQNYMLAKMV